MNSLLIDTNAYTAFAKGASEAALILQHASLLAVNPVVLGELQGGFAAGSKQAANKTNLAQFVASHRVIVLPIDEGTVQFYAQIYAALRKAGTAIPTNDLWIAATALQHGLRLYTHDKHFKNIPGLRIGESFAELSAK